MVKKAAQATPNLLLRAAFNNALAVIQSYSLLRRSSREQTLSMHRVVQAVLADAMTNQERDQWTDQAIAALNALFPEVRHQAWGQWGQCVRLLPPGPTVAAATATQQHNLELASLQRKTADYLLQRAQYQQAKPLYQRALSLGEPGRLPAQRAGRSLSRTGPIRAS